MQRLIYNVLVHLATPPALAAILLRGLRNPAHRGRLGERLGYVRLDAAGDASDRLWIHAVSVGEVQAAAVLLRSLQRRYPRYRLLVTTATPTGARRVRDLFGDQVQHAYLPYDLPGAVRRFLSAARPAIAIVMEREIWPNLFCECAGRGIPVLLASARLTERSMRLHRRFAALFAPALDKVIVAAQTAADAQRFLAIGAPAPQVHVTGNIKFDMEVDEGLPQAGDALRAAQFPDRLVWVAGSTHEGEEDVLLDAHRRVCLQHPGCLLVLAPRHPERFDPVRACLKARGVRFASRSAGTSVGADTEVLLVDTLGELMLFYAAGDIAFVGGSLVPVGGHNLLEPAVLARPIVVGPYNFNGPDIARMFLDSGAAVEAASAAPLAKIIIELAGDTARRVAMGHLGRRIVTDNRGAAAHMVQLIEASLR
ncbi:3-deoxy-D-manno-octulosonic-acid transferase [Steroidobacter denitrificans]|uniref:3-deoxy-D-manno-octulosonic acid transferase n=1 Tax=Steroidobacter denitrificans TaxID=465721 RepID=A0A127F902_STEDE|nr:lipid IV(A) 3-deoxy-D-manno-octulosonic acid transferase [Steroidobacter denitrificans]AMN46088.1 3-deoxy-D-manno-octulosonic-acid transferase [Steroidobacter denitrificans]